MKRKTILLISLIFLLSLSLVFVGCQKAETPDDDSSNNNDSSSSGSKYIMATGGTGGTYYPLGGAMADTWDENIDDVQVTVRSTGASVENMRLLSSGDVDLAMAMNGPATQAYEGTGDFEGNKLENFRAVGVIYPEVMQVIAPKSKEIKNIEDLKGKRVSIGPSGSGTASGAQKILEAHGINPDEDIDRFDDTFTDAASKLKDGNLDAAFAVLAVPAANVVDITTSKPVNIVNIEGDGLDKLLEEAPAFSPYEIPKDTYDGMEDTGHTVSQWAVLYCPEDMSEDDVYNLTKVMYENTDEIADAHDRGNQIDIENALEGIDPVPFHPGAEKYYQEEGIMD